MVLKVEFWREFFRNDRLKSVTNVEFGEKLDSFEDGIPIWVCPVSDCIGFHGIHAYLLWWIWPFLHICWIKKGWFFNLRCACNQNDTMCVVWWSFNYFFWKIRHASVERLLDRLTDLRFLSIDFLNTFLLTYRVFTTGKTVLEALGRVYRNPEYGNLDATSSVTANVSQEVLHR